MSVQSVQSQSIQSQSVQSRSVQSQSVQSQSIQSVKPNNETNPDVLLHLKEGQTVHTIARKINRTEVKIALRQEMQIGAGAFGIVNKMLVKENNNENSVRYCAVKIPSTRGDLAKIELYLLLKLQHDNVARLLYYFIPKGLSEHIIIVLELVPGGDLFSYMRDINRKYDQRPYLRMGSLFELFSYQLFRGLAYCHSRKVCHRDIKPENLLISPVTGVLKIADFGCGAEFQTPQKETHAWYIGTRVFRAPELLLGADTYDFKVDVWSAAIVITEMMMGAPIFFSPERDLGPLLIVMFEHLGIPKQTDLEDMNATHFHVPPELPRRISLADRVRQCQPRNEDGLIKLLSSLLVYSPDDRLSAWEALGHDFFDSLAEIDVLDSGKAPPDLYNFSRQEVDAMPRQVRIKFGFERA